MFLMISSGVRIATAKTWREPVKKRRCLVSVDAFYEWPKEGKPPKQPYAFEMASGKPFAFAGLWDGWKDGQGHWLQSFSIVTTKANELMLRIHPRMPVILEGYHPPGTQWRASAAKVCTSEARKTVGKPLARARGGASQEGLVSFAGREAQEMLLAVF